MLFSEVVLSRLISKPGPLNLPGLAMLLAGLLVLSGCAQMKEWTHWEDEEPEAPALDDGDGDSPGYRYQQVVQWLQAGEVAIAERTLEQRLENAPDDQRARLLMEQIQADPEAYFGDDSIAYEVESGDTLSVIAQHFLGDNRLFFILARYNNIDVPAHLEVGRTLRIPRYFNDIDAERRLEQMRASAQHPTSAAWALLESGEPDKALALFDERPPESLNSDEKRALAEAHEAWVEKALGQGELTLAETRLNQARADEPDSVDWSDWIAEAQRRIDSEALYRDGRARMAESPVAAARNFSQVLAMNPEHAGAREALDGLRDQVVPKLHREAILLYRNHELEAAINTWEVLLRIDPDFEPAQVYKTRATELQARLKELD